MLPQVRRLDGPLGCALTVDVEEWYHNCLVPDFVEPERRPTLPRELDRLLPQTLELLAEHGCRATFFTLGEVADELVLGGQELQALPHDPIAVASREGAAQFHAEMERRLGTQDYLAGSYSFADIAFYMAQLFGERMGAPLADDTARLLAWRERVGTRPAVREVVGAMVAFLVSQGRPIPPYLASPIPAPPRPS